MVEAGRESSTFARNVTPITLGCQLWMRPPAERKSLRAVGASSDLGRSWSAVLRDWQTLDQFVRLQRLERGLKPHWFDRNLDSQLQHWMEAKKHPMKPCFEKHETAVNSTMTITNSGSFHEVRAQGMWDAFTSLYEVIDVPQDAYEAHQMYITPYFPGTPSKDIRGGCRSREKHASNIIYGSRDRP